MLRGSFGRNNEGHPGQAGACRSSEPASRRRSDNSPSAALGSWQVHDRLESQLFDEESPAPLLIPDPEGHKV